MNIAVGIKPDAQMAGPADNTAPVSAPDAEQDYCEKHPVVVVGGGPVGTRAAQELASRGEEVILINAERWKPYNRVKLTPLLAGEAQLGQIYLDETMSGESSFRRYDGVAVTDIDRETKRLKLSSGRIQPYDKLVLALGSRAFVPKIPGKEMPGVYVFRDFNDAEALIARSISARNVVVIGGGLLGLEAARGMMKRGAKVSVVEFENRLMPRQLDLKAANHLKDRIESIGISVSTGKQVKAIEGDSRVEEVCLSDGSSIAADTVIICTGIRANTQLAGAIDLPFNNGILVNNGMRTIDEDIYAIGECAEHDGKVYGLVGPGYEQAMAAVDAICGDGEKGFGGATPAAKLKVVGADVFSMGDFESYEQLATVKAYGFEDEENGLYRRIFVQGGRIVAALGVGEWPEVTKIQQAITRRARVFGWTGWRFQSTGILWSAEEDSVAAWPADAIVCNCTGVTKGAIVDCVAAGASSLEEVRAACSANTVCGTCQPLVLEIMGSDNAKPEPAKWWKALLAFSCVATLAALATALLPRIPAPGSYITGDLWFNLWFDSIWKQYSGYTLLGLTVAAALIGMRKRIGFMARLGGYNGWRVAHLLIGVVSALVLVWHTGFRLGNNLNFLLMMSFLVTLIFGAIAGLITGGEHKLQEQELIQPTDKPRTMPMWVHILALWPLPVLLFIHILTVYAY